MRATEFTQPPAAGCIIVAADTGRWCLQQRSNTVSDPGVWSTWGGGSEPGETLEQTVRRELAEESGYTGPVQLELVDSNPKYATFMAQVPYEFDPQLNSESQDWCWCEPDQLPEPLHPGLAQLVSKNINEDVYDVLQPLDCGPFDGGCVLVAQALQQIYGGRVVVLTDENDRAQHAAVLANGQLIDYDGAADPKEFVQRFEQNERVRIQGIRPIRGRDLPDAPRDPQLVAQLVQTLGENFADGKKPGRKGLSKRVGIPQKATLSQLEKIAKSSTGERRRMAQWQLNMRRGKAKKNK
jgi:8-oxo-dGTP pyrophosphatase MutT (NUDIX family)